VTILASKFRDIELQHTNPSYIIFPSLLGILFESRTGLRTTTAFENSEDQDVTHLPNMEPDPKASLESLPAELYDEVLSYLDVDPPSYAEVPIYLNLECLESSVSPLKSISLLSHRWRLVSLPRLFRHARVCLSPRVQDVSGGGEDEILESFLRFFGIYGLERYLQSIVVYSEQSWIAEPLDNGRPMNTFWPLVCGMSNLRRLQMIAPPGDLGRLLSLPTYMENSWAFDMPFQSVLLELPQRLLQRVEPSPASAPSLSNILSAVPWTGLSLNEGSFLRSYGVYEYYLNMPPCLMKSRIGPLLDTLTVLRYKAIFPFFNHFRSEVLRFAVRCTQLKELSIQLVPDAQDHILDDARRTSKLDVTDVWMEIDSAYGAVHTLLSVLLSLECFSTPDWRIGRIVDLIEGEGENVLQRWMQQSRGVWTRDLSLNVERP
jgi:hypothetical protein